MDKNLIKKELYKQKPDADFNFQDGDIKIYSTRLVINDRTEIIEFDIPLKECDFGEVVPAQLLIRWINL